MIDWTSRSLFRLSVTIADLCDNLRFSFDMQGTVSVWKELPKKLLGQSDFTFASMMNLVNRYILPQENAEWAESTTERLLSQILVSSHLHMR
jgi:hypothetical protein